MMDDIYEEFRQTGANLKFTICYQFIGNQIDFSNVHDLHLELEAHEILNLGWKN